MRERRISWLLGVLAAGVLAVSGCGNTHGLGFGSESNWLRACGRRSDCNAGSCVCGVCSAACAEDSDCPGGLRCQNQSSELYTQACGVDLRVQGLCAPVCKRDADCSAGQTCSGGACKPGTSTAGGLGAAESSLAAPDGGTPPGGGRQLVADAHLDLTPACLPDLERPIGSGAGVFDLGGSGAPSGGCRRPYVLTLRVHNLAAEDVVATKVQVLLLSDHGEVIAFDRITPVIPNPFELSITGSVAAATGGEPGVGAILAEAIPANYAAQLDLFVGRELAIRAQLSGETLSGAQVRSNAFEYRVGVCDHCLIKCQSEVDASGQTVGQIVGDRCDDGAAADGRICFDPGC